MKEINININDNKNNIKGINNNISNLKNDKK